MLRPFFRGCFNGLWHTTAAAAAAEEAVLSGSLGVWGCCCTSLGRLHLSGKNGWREAIVIQVILSLIDKNKPVMSSQVNPFPAYLFQDLSLRISKGEFDKFNNNSYQVKVTMFENHKKGLIQPCKRSELRLHFEWTKVNWKLHNLKLAGAVG